MMKKFDSVIGKIVSLCKNFNSYFLFSGYYFSFYFGCVN